jgi:hypothetical protein
MQATIDLINHNVGVVICLSAIATIIVLTAAISALQSELAFRMHILIARLDTAAEQRSGEYDSISSQLDSIHSEVSKIESNTDLDRPREDY